MKKLMFLVALVAVAAPVALAAPGAQTPAGACKAELKLIGEANFKSLYAPGGSGASAMGKCVSKHQRSAEANRVERAEDVCRRSATRPRRLQGRSRRQVVRRGLRPQRERPERLRQVRVGESIGRRRPSGERAPEGREGLQDRARHDADSRAAFTAKYGGKAASASASASRARASPRKSDGATGCCGSTRGEGGAPLPRRGPS